MTAARENVVRRRPVPRPPLPFPGQGDAGLGALAIALGGLWALFFLYSIHVQLPATPVELPGEAHFKELASAVTPQGWAFFTINPRRSQVLPYVRPDDGGWLPADEAVGDPAHAFGLNREGRLAASEIEVLAALVPDGRWAPCSRLAADCLDALQPVGTFANPSLTKSICGEVGLVDKEPVSWAYATDAETVTSGRAARLVVRC